MYARILRFGWITLLPVFVLALVTGCGDKADKKQSGLEIELFAKAQEFQKKEKYEDAIQTYRRIVKDYSDTRQGANSQFMIGYIYANHVKDLEQAVIELNRFLDEYSEVSDSGLIAGAKFELLYMGKDIDDIPILTDLGGKDSLVTESESGSEEK